jgi:sugar lactone lactonase YvrE
MKNFILVSLFTVVSQFSSYGQVYVSTQNLSAFATFQGTASEAQSFFLDGQDIQYGVELRAPAGFELSASSDFTNAQGTLLISEDYFSLEVYVRISASTQAGYYSGNISIQQLSGWGDPVNVSIPNSAVNYVVYEPNVQVSTFVETEVNFPAGMAFDVSGNLFAACGNFIKKITPDGTVSIFAGTENHGGVDGQGTNASFQNPRALVFDESGNLYVGGQNYKIRKITPDGMVSTFVGSGNVGTSDGQGLNAEFASIGGLAIDNSGNIYATDSYNTIRKITPDGLVSTIAGYPGSTERKDGQGTSASFVKPGGITIDLSGNLFVTDGFTVVNTFGSHTIRKITPSGTVSTFAGDVEGINDGKGTKASFNYMGHITVDSSGTIYVSDGDNYKIRKVTSDGTVTTVAGSGARGSINGKGENAAFGRPNGIVLDNAGNLFVADNYESKIRKIVIGKEAKNDLAISPTVLDSGVVSVDSTNNYALGRQITSSCTTSVSNLNTIDAFFSFVSPGVSASLILSLGDASWSSSMELIDTSNYSSIDNTCLNNVDFGQSQRVHTFDNLTAGKTYFVRLEIGGSGPLGTARRTGSDKSFSVALASVTGIENNDNQSKHFTNVYPNPAKEFLTVSLSTNSNGSVEIINGLGEVVLSNAINNKTTTFSTRYLSNGIYIVKILTDKGIDVRQIVIEN